MAIAQKRKKKKREYEEAGAKLQRDIRRQSRIQRTRTKAK